MLLPFHKRVFDLIQRSAGAGVLCLLECTDKATKEKVAVVCAAIRDEQGGTTLTPLARLFNLDPHETLDPPEASQEGKDHV